MLKLVQQIVLCVVLLAVITNIEMLGSCASVCFLGHS